MVLQSHADFSICESFAFLSNAYIIRGLYPMDGFEFLDLLGYMVAYIAIQASSIVHSVTYFV